MTSNDLIAACLEGCTEPQREAIQHIDGPLLVLAGPGSGKTRVITRRIAHLIANGVRPNDIVAITFTNKAAGEMNDRVKALGVRDGAQISTFHSFCARMLRIHARHVGLKQSFTIYDSADSISAVKRVMEELGVEPQLLKPSYVARQISSAKNRFWTPDIIRKSGIAEADAVASIYERYRSFLLASNAADFDDLLLLMVKLLTEAPETREQLSRRYRYVLVDEYQDTNRAQYLIASHLAAAHGNLCVTGDPDQSIYAWRGADISNILDFEKDYPQAKIVRLEQNYRSTQRILKAADSVIAHNLERKEKTLWTENPAGEQVELLRLSDDRAEADAVAGSISRLVRQGIAPGNIAVFYRLNAHSRTLEASLRGEGVPYHVVAGTEFYQRKEIKDLLAYLRLIDNPADDVSLERIVNTPTRKIGGTTLSRLKKWGSARGLTLLQAMARAPEADVRGPALQGIADLRRLLDTLRAMPRNPVAPIVERLIQSINFEKHLLADLDKGPDRVDNVRELVSDAAQFNQDEPEGDLQGFLERVALVSDQDALNKKQGVSLMTLHAAKGLEFDAVFIVGLEEGILPLRRDDGDHDMEEERRLFFVGLTRARKLATISYADCRLRYGKTEYMQPSCFLQELPEEIRPDVEAPALDHESTTGGMFHSPFGGSAQQRWPKRDFSKPRSTSRTVSRGDSEIVYDAEPAFSSDAPPPPFKAGDSVIHPTYGRGKVLALSGYGENLRATVHFPIHGAKNLVLKFAKLRKA